MHAKFYEIIKVLIINLLIAVSLKSNKINCLFYKTLKNIAINSTLQQSNSIQMYNYANLQACLLKCNENSACLTTQFNQNTTIQYNCILYNRFFDSSEMEASTAESIYAKKTSMLQI